MAKYLLEHAFGDYVWDPSGFLAPKPKKGSLKPIPPELRAQSLAAFKDPQAYPKFRVLHLKRTIQAISESFSPDQHIIQVAHAIEELQKAFNTLTKRAREWFAYHNPVYEHEVSTNNHFLEGIRTAGSGSMGGQFSHQDLELVQAIAEEALRINLLIEDQEAYQEKKMQQLMPNVLVLTGAKVGSKLLMYAGSLKHLATMTASTVQLLGAEKALFRHLTKKTKPPKYGLLHEHPLVSKVPAKQKGKAASALADKIVLAARVDYFKGKPIAVVYKKELEERFGTW